MIEFLPLDLNIVVLMYKYWAWTNDVQSLVLLEMRTVEGFCTNFKKYAYYSLIFNGTLNEINMWCVRLTNNNNTVCLLYIFIRRSNWNLNNFLLPIRSSYKIIIIILKMIKLTVNPTQMITMRNNYKFYWLS